MEENRYNCEKQVRMELLVPFGRSTFVKEVTPVTTVEGYRFLCYVFYTCTDLYIRLTGK